MLIFIAIDGTQRQDCSARRHGFTHAHRVQGLAERWRVVIDVQYYHSHLQHTAGRLINTRVELI